MLIFAGSSLLWFMLQMGETEQLRFCKIAAKVNKKSGWGGGRGGGGEAWKLRILDVTLTL